MTETPSSEKPKVETLGSNLRFSWIECVGAMSNPLAWLPTARMTFGDGEPKRIRIGKLGGRGVTSAGTEAVVWFDRRYVVAWIAQKLLRPLKGLTIVEVCELINEAWMELDNDAVQKLRRKGEVQAPTEDGERGSTGFGAGG